MVDKTDPKKRDWSYLCEAFSKLDGDHSIDPKGYLHDKLRSVSVFLGKWIEVHGSNGELPQGYTDEIHDLLIDIDDFVDWAEDWHTTDPG